jgi:hypothetical protein
MVSQVETKVIEYDVRDLAKRFAMPPSEAHDMLWNEIHQLEQAARIQDFVPVLALKHVKEHLRDRPAQQSA